MRRARGGGISSCRDLLLAANQGPKLSDPGLAAPPPQQIWGPHSQGTSAGEPQQLSPLRLRAPPAPCHYSRDFPFTFKAGVLSQCQGPPLPDIEGYLLLFTPLPPCA